MTNRLRSKLDESSGAGQCLNETLFTSMAQARAVLVACLQDYNTIRPHSKLGGLNPAAQ